MNRVDWARWSEFIDPPAMRTIERLARQGRPDAIRVFREQSAKAAEAAAEARRLWGDYQSRSTQPVEPWPCQLAPNTIPADPRRARRLWRRAADLSALARELKIRSRVLGY